MPPKDEGFINRLAADRMTHDVYTTRHNVRASRRSLRLVDRGANSPMG